MERLLNAIKARINELEKEKARTKIIADGMSFRHNFQEKINALNKIEYIDGKIIELKSLLNV